MRADTYHRARRDYTFTLAPSMCIRCSDCPSCEATEGQGECRRIDIVIADVNRSRCPLHPALLRDAS